jgi:hypothetical protein
MPASSSPPSCTEMLGRATGPWPIERVRRARGRVRGRHGHDLAVRERDHRPAGRPRPETPPGGPGREEGSQTVIVAWSCTRGPKHRARPPGPRTARHHRAARGTGSEASWLSARCVSPGRGASSAPRSCAATSSRTRRSPTWRQPGERLDDGDAAQRTQVGLQMSSRRTRPSRVREAARGGARHRSLTRRAGPKQTIKAR